MRRMASRSSSLAGRTCHAVARRSEPVGSVMRCMMRVMTVKQREVGELQELSAFLRLRFGDRATAPAYLAEGAWSRCYALALDGRECVVRVGRHLEDFEKDAFAVRFASPGL